MNNFNQENQVVDNILNPIEQMESHNKTSNRYNFVNTSNILERLSFHGWTVRQSQAVRCRNENNIGFQKHLIRLVHEDFKYGDYYIEILLTNSHLGNSSVKLALGIYRLVCSNGLVVGKTFFERRIRHTGFTYDKLDNALIQVMAQAPKVNKAIAIMKARQLTENEMLELAQTYVNKRLEKVKNVNWVDMKRLFDLYREEDRATDLFTVYNVLQEKVINGGIRYTTNNPIMDVDPVTNEPIIKEYEEKNHSTKRIKSIDTNTNINAFMFDEAMKLAA